MQLGRVLTLVVFLIGAQHGLAAEQPANAPAAARRRKR